jgi:hypothetical protein
VEEERKSILVSRGEHWFFADKTQQNECPCEDFLEYRKSCVIDPMPDCKAYDCLKLAEGAGLMHREHEKDLYVIPLCKDHIAHHARSLKLKECMAVPILACKQPGHN